MYTLSHTPCYLIHNQQQIPPRPHLSTGYAQPMPNVYPLIHRYAPSYPQSCTKLSTGNAPLIHSPTLSYTQVDTKVCLVIHRIIHRPAPATPSRPVGLVNVSASIPKADPMGEMPSRGEARELTHAYIKFSILVYPQAYPQVPQGTC